MQPDLLFLLCDTARADAFQPWGGPLETPAMSCLCREGAFYAEAVAQARQSIRKLARERPDARIVVTGCAAQVDPADRSKPAKASRTDASSSTIQTAAVGFGMNDPSGMSGARTERWCRDRRARRPITARRDSRQWSG